MAGKKIIQGNQGLNYTCENLSFKTDITKGCEHRQGQGYKGSVTSSPLFDDGMNSLWLEWVIDKNNPSVPKLWFMWYHNSGTPLIPLSGIISESEITEVIRNISQIKF